MQEQHITYETHLLAKERGFTCEFNDVSQSILQRWLREEYDIHILVNSLKPNEDKYYRIVYNFNKQDYIINRTKLLKFKTYEGALEYSLVEALAEL